MNDHSSGVEHAGAETSGAEALGQQQIQDGSGNLPSTSGKDPNLAIGDGCSSAFQKYVKAPQGLLPQGDAEQLAKRSAYPPLSPSARGMELPLSMVQPNSFDSGDQDIDEDEDEGVSDQQFGGGPHKEGKSKKRGKSNSADENSKSKKQRLIWTPELHARFLNAVNHLGVKNAVPKTILQLMNVEGMTRENVASHLQKYRLYLKRLAGLPPNAPLSAETLQQVQSVQQAMQQQIQAGFQKSQSALPLGGSVAFSSSPLTLGTTTPLTLSLAGLQNPQLDLLTQLQLAAVGPNPATTNPAAAAAVAAAAAAQGLQNGSLQTASALSALRQNPLLGSMGVLPNLLSGIPLAGLSPIHLAGLAGFNPSLLGAGSVVNPLAGQALLLQGANGVLPSSLIPAASQAPSQPFQ